MPLNLRGTAAAGGVLWGGSFLLVSLLNLVAPGYGVTFLEVGASIYPGYPGPGGLGAVTVVTLYGVLDGAVAGAIVAWVYNAARGAGSSAGGVS